MYVWYDRISSGVVGWRKWRENDKREIFLSGIKIERDTERVKRGNMRYRDGR